METPKSDAGITIKHRSSNENHAFCVGKLLTVYKDYSKRLKRSLLDYEPTKRHEMKCNTGFEHCSHDDHDSYQKHKGQQRSHVHIYINIHILYYFEDNISKNYITVRYISNIP